MLSAKIIIYLRLLRNHVNNKAFLRDTRKEPVRQNPQLVIVAQVSASDGTAAGRVPPEQKHRAGVVNVDHALDPLQKLEHKVEADLRRPELPGHPVDPGHFQRLDPAHEPGVVAPANEDPRDPDGELLRPPLQQLEPAREKELFNRYLYTSRHILNEMKVHTARNAGFEPRKFASKAKAVA